MPLYEYKCTNCAEISEFILKHGDAPMEGCRFCGEKRLARVLYSRFSVGTVESSSSDCAMKSSCGDMCGSPQCGLKDFNG